jgi:hypothetical protein
LVFDEVAAPVPVIMDEGGALETYVLSLMIAVFGKTCIKRNCKRPETSLPP